MNHAEEVLPGDQPNEERQKAITQELIPPGLVESKRVDQERINKIAKQILGNERLETILTFYFSYNIAERNKLNGENVRENEDNARKYATAVLKKYPDLSALLARGEIKHFVEAMEMKYKDFQSSMEEFQEIVYGRHQEHRPPAREVPSLPPTDFLNPERKAKAGQVEFLRDYNTISSLIRHDNQARGLVAHFVYGNFELRSTLALDANSLAQHIGSFLTTYPTLDDFEGKNRVNLFLDAIRYYRRETKNIDEEQTKAKREQYKKTIANFEDKMYGHHVDR